MNELQNNLVLDHLYLAEIIAKNNNKKYNSSYDEVLSAAYFGLVSAANKFNSSISNNFKSYASDKINGAILDFFREQNWFSRCKIKKKRGELQDCFFQEEKEDNSYILEVLEKLPKRHKEVMNFYYIKNYKLDEIAEVFGLKKARISQILSEAKEQLRSMVSL